MRTIKLFFLLAPAFFACAGLQAQVVIGSVVDEPAKGALLDLNSPTGNKGGLLLSNVDITNLDLIPKGGNTFSSVSPDSLDVNWGLRGAVVYNTNPETVPGIYVWTGRYWMPADETEPVEQILFTVRIGSDGDDSYAIPTSGMLNFTNHAYDWDVTVDGQPATATNCTDGYCSGTGSMSDAGVNGIQLSGLAPGNHQIRITPHGEAAPGWGNAFGYCCDLDGNLLADGANAVTSREKLISIDAPLTTLAFAPKTDESITNAAFMFTGVFSGCTSLTAPAVIRDSYKLPATVTDLSGFLAGVHLHSDAIATPIDLKHLKNWLKNNSSIKNLSYFLAAAHYINNLSLTAPIDLTPLSGWFKGNESIENLSFFLYNTYYRSSNLAEPIDLTPLSGWFKGNESIKNLSHFLAETHYENALIAPINLTPLSGWFKDNESIENLLDFLFRTHSSNINLTNPINLAHLSGWFTTNRSITNLYGFLQETHRYNDNLILKGEVIFPDWIKTMTQDGTTPIWNVPNTFFRTFLLDSSTQNNNIEPKFETGSEGITVLSGLPNPTVTNVINDKGNEVINNDGESDTNKGTYRNRTGISLSNNWQ